MKVNCDKCKKDFQIDVKTKKHSGGVRETYFKCPHCKTKYIGYFTDKDIRKQQSEIRKLYDKYKNENDLEKAERIEEEIRKAKHELKLKMDKLKEQMMKIGKQEREHN